MPYTKGNLLNRCKRVKLQNKLPSNLSTLLKGAPALESRTEGRLVSPTTAAEKKKLYPHQDLALKLDLSIVEHARVCKCVVYILEHVFFYSY